jgi:hypothetical protein
MSRRTMLASLLFATSGAVAAFGAASCSAAYADQSVAGPALPPAHIALGVAPQRLRAPYDVQILRADGGSLPTYAFRDRYYVEGSADERYVIRITNPTPRRIEAVVSVDGLDVIDGENGDLRKRGYVVPAYGETQIEGFRTSQADVATFRFSSVGASYAGQKGKPRNVGVIAVALFEEQPLPGEQEIIVGGRPAPRPISPRRPYDYRDDLDRRGAADAAKSAKADERVSRNPATAPPPSAASDQAVRAPATAAAPSGGAGRASESLDRYDDDAAMPEPRQVPQRERLGLGTEFGEQRYSAASYTRFVRGSGRPVAIAELRYNDTAGLIALGIPLQPMPDDRELILRETANPFPGDHFARPPH